MLRKQTPDVLEQGKLIAMFVIGCCESVKSAQSVCPFETGLKSDIINHLPGVNKSGNNILILKWHRTEHNLFKTHDQSCSKASFLNAVAPFGYGVEALVLRHQCDTS